MTGFFFAVDKHGAPLLEATTNAPSKAEVKVEPDEAKVQASIHRRRDAVVDAARTIEDLSPAGVEAFMRQRWRGDRAVTAEDFESFSADARAQRVHDVADAIDHRIRRAIHGRAGSKQVHVSLPRGVGAKSLASLEPEELEAIAERLRDRGWTDQQIKRHGMRRLDRDGKARSVVEKGSSST